MSFLSRFPLRHLPSAVGSGMAHWTSCPPQRHAWHGNATMGICNWNLVINWTAKDLSLTNEVSSKAKRFKSLEVDLRVSQHVSWNVGWGWPSRAPANDAGLLRINNKPCSQLEQVDPRWIPSAPELCQEERGYPGIEAEDLATMPRVALRNCLHPRSTWPAEFPQSEPPKLAGFLRIKKGLPCSQLEQVDPRWIPSAPESGKPCRGNFGVEAARLYFIKWAFVGLSQGKVQAAGQYRWIPSAPESGKPCRGNFGVEAARLYFIKWAFVGLSQGKVQAAGQYRWIPSAPESGKPCRGNFGVEALRLYFIKWAFVGLSQGKVQAAGQYRWIPSAPELRQKARGNSGVEAQHLTSQEGNFSSSPPWSCTIFHSQRNSNSVALSFHTRPTRTTLVGVRVMNIS